MGTSGRPPEPRDEADRLTTKDLEQLRSTFDEGGLGTVLIGMPGIESASHAIRCSSPDRLRRCFRPLPDSEIEILLLKSLNAHRSRAAQEPEVAAAITRLTRGNFRLLAHLLKQMPRVLDINSLIEFSIYVVETTRENLVIGQP